MLGREKEIVRVLRIIEYYGDREWVEETIRKSIHGTKDIFGHGTITGTTLKDFPEIVGYKSEPENKPEDEPEDGGEDAETDG